MKDLLEYTSLEHNRQEEFNIKYNEAAKSSLQAILMIASTLETKDSYSKGHSIKVAECCNEIGKRMGFNEEELNILHYVVMLYDIGKIGIPDTIIGKPSSLSKEEYEIVKTHTLLGDNILKDLSIWPSISECARYHHERFDGLGYPDGLKGDEIPISARIIGVADSYIAMTSNRAYRNALNISEAKKQIFAGKEKQFDPFIADIMLEMLEDGFDSKIHQVYRDSLSKPISDNTKKLQRVMQEYAKESYNNSFKDKLTSVWNRDYICKYVDEYLSDPLNYGILFMMDLDNFKSINDIYGHSAGDGIIIMLAETMQEIVGDVGIPARIGGDEFVIFFPNENSNDYIQMIADNIINAMKLKIEKNRKGSGVSVSIGIAKSNERIDSFEALFENADRALYYVKEHGKGYSHSYNINEYSDQNDRNIEANAKYLKKILAENSAISGAYRVGYDGFAKIYQFVSRRMDRTKNSSILIVYTIFDKNENMIDSRILAEAMVMLEITIVKLLRKGDVTTRYSDCQQLVMLLDTLQCDWEIIAKRISEVFKQYFKDKVDISFEITNIGS